MHARRWLLLLLLVAASLSLAPARADGGAAARGAEPRAGDWPSMAADHEESSGDLRSPEESGTTAAASHVVVPSGAVDVGARAVAPGAGLWCDVIQCRLQAGAQVLCYAKPPPAGRG